MRIALFTDTYEPDVNGVARTLARWVKYLEARNIPCKVYAPDHNRMEHVRENMVERFFSIPFMLYPECRLAVPNPVSVRKSLLRFNPTLIHVATPFNMGLFGLRLAKKHDIPLVASYHTHFDRYLSYYRLQWMEPMLWRYMHWFHQDCRKIFVPSRSTLRHLRKKGFENLEVWGRGVDTKRFRPCVKREEVLSFRKM